MVGHRWLMVLHRLRHIISTVKGQGLLTVRGSRMVITWSPGPPFLPRAGASSKQIEEWSGQATNKVVQQRVGCSPDSRVLRLGGDQEP